MRPKNIAIVAATVVLAGCAVSAGIATADHPAPRTTMDHDGTYSVGTDIVPGTYSSAGPVGNGVCSWKLLSGPSRGDITESVLSKMPEVVQIDPTDTTFRTDGCQPWRKTDSASADGTTPGSFLH